MLKVDKLSKTFDRGRLPALDDVSFAVDRGNICGLLGHNGAGKSTALGIILGMVYPDLGEVSIDGVVVQQNREKAISKVGAIFETPSFYEYLSGWHNLKIFSAYSGGVTEKLMRETVAWVGLEERIGDRVSKYSHGMRQRLALAQALLPRPELLILDEPTDGLDPEGIVEFREQLFELRDRLGLTVLLSSHLLGEVEQVCDEVVILQAGRKVYSGAVREVETEMVRFRIEAEKPSGLEKLVIEEGGSAEGESRFLFPPGRKADELLAALVSGDVGLRHFSQEEDSLESLYLRFSQSKQKEDI
ncbi:MAG: ABC transporter ATP-binding protein [Verrucomicrobiales bacterium]|nr:ABC transporter ATP-binding protein [Verrucomicrobiales bacterium]